MNADIAMDKIAAKDLAVVSTREGRFTEADSIYRQILAHDPNYVDAHVNLAMLRLLLGDFDEGWREFEWRYKREISLPRWDGSELNGELVVMHAEQGMGDHIQFIRYAPLVLGRGARVAVFCKPGLKRLLSTTPWDIDVFTEGEDVHGAVFEAPFFSVPGICGTNLDNIPAPIPYLAAEPDLVELWRTRLADRKGLKVGLCWQGNAKNPTNIWRSVSLAHLEPVLKTPGVTFVSLQVGQGAEDVATVSPSLAPIDVSDDLEGGSEHFIQDAALMMNLDLIITVDTAVAHLAGALGRPVWVLLARAPDWRWLLDRTDSPWYPSARLFRQTHPGQWNEPINRMADELTRLAAGGQ